MFTHSQEIGRFEIHKSGGIVIPEEIPGSDTFMANPIATKYSDYDGLTIPPIHNHKVFLSCLSIESYVVRNMGYYMADPKGYEFDSDSFVAKIQTALGTTGAQYLPIDHNLDPFTVYIKTLFDGENPMMHCSLIQKYDNPDKNNRHSRRLENDAIVRLFLNVALAGG